MLLVGFLSLCQIAFLPGYLCLQAFRLPSLGLLRTVLYSFGLSLLANHALVYALYSAGLYSAPVMFGIVALEWLLLLGLIRRERFKFSLELPSKKSLDSYRALWRDYPIAGRLIVIPASAALIASGLLCYTYFGSVFVLNDDVLSWDRWAMEWARNQLTGTGLYPQLLPTNFSISYVLLGNTDVKMFAKAIMPFFTLGTLLLFLDLFNRSGRVFWLVSLSCYWLLVSYVFNPIMLASGYADAASAFFAFLTLHAFLQYDLDTTNFRIRPILVVLFASAGMLTKQGGIYLFVLALVWLIAYFAPVRERFSWRTPALLLALVLLVNWRWVVTEWNVYHGQIRTNLRYLTEEIHAGKTYPERWQSAWTMIQNVRGPQCKPIVWLLAAGVLLSVFHRLGKWVFFLIFAPYYALWAFLFSYEVRTLVMDFPFAAACFACGVAVVGQFVRNRIPLLVLLLGSGLLAVLIVAGDSLQSWLQSSTWLLEMRSSLKWPLAIGCAVALIAPSLANRLSPLRLRLSAPILMAVFAAIVAAGQTTIWPTDRVVREQIEKRKVIGSPSLDWKLYEYAKRKPPTGKIVTDNFFLEYLPELNQYQRYLLFPQPASEDFLEKVMADPEVRYILAYERAFTPALDIWMSQQGIKTVFREQGYRFLELPVKHLRGDLSVQGTGHLP